MSKSITLTTMFSTVLIIVRLPGLPVTSMTLPLRAMIVGVCELSMRLPGAIKLASVPIAPLRSVTPGLRLKSSISSLSRNPAPLTTTREP